jgi:hypothetical protein
MTHGGDMNIYRKMHKDFFFAVAGLRNTYGIHYLSSDHIFAGKWLTEDEIADFTLAYMGGGEL